MDKFTEIKEEILRRAKNARACVEQYKRALESETLQELAHVIKDNFTWCCDNKVLDVEIIKKYKAEFAPVEIYANESISSGYVLIDGKVEKLSGSAFAYMLGNSTVVEMWGNSTIARMFDNSTVTKMFDNSTVTKMFDNSTVVEMWGNSTVVEMWGNSIVAYMSDNSTVTKMFDNSTVVEMWGNSIVAYMSDNSTVVYMINNSTVAEMRCNSTVTEMWGYAYISTYNYIECKISENAIMRVVNENKIYTNTTVEKPKL